MRLKTLMTMGMASFLAAPGAWAVDFNKEIRPILMESCAACHGGVKKSAEVSVIYRDSILGKTRAGEAIVQPGEPETSVLYQRVSTDDPDDRMPPLEAHAVPLSDGEIESLRQWIADGAVWEELWSHVPPQRPALPKVKRQDWAKRPVDSFILAKMEAAGLAPAKEAPRRAWLRRVTFDITGLPPTPQEIADFEGDTGPGAEARVVDRLLASPRFGERWAALWLDFARYADSAGYEKDAHRDVWAFRDWVIRAFNDDMPFDDFTVKQLAGDLLPDPTLDDMIATGFNRNTTTNVEGGTDDEEFRTLSVIDRVNTTWQVWQGTTFGCIQCHGHPYDPIPHEAYYEFLSFFNNTLDADLGDEFPKLDVPHDPEKKEEVWRLEQAFASASDAMMRPFRAQDSKTEWRDFASHAVRTSKNVIARVETVDALPTIVTEGTLARGSEFWTTLEGADAPIAALRLEALLPPGHDAANPTDGFVVSHLTVDVVPAAEDGEKRSVEIAFVAADNVEGNLWPLDALNEGSSTGWGTFPKLFHDRWAVAVLKEPVTLGEGESLEVKFKCGYGKDGGNQPVIKRFRIRYDTDPAWQEVLQGGTLAAAREARTDAHERLKRIERTTIPVMQERPDTILRETRVFLRGNWLDKGEVVEADIPALFGELPEDAPRNRLSAARWFVSDENPLTARVMANHVWAQFFGRGIVATVGDFGSSGAPPTHQGALDHLAIQFRDDFDWSFKQLVREIALSATYRQDATTTAALLEQDPLNLLYARGPRTRLSAEMVRDQALAAAGLLSEKMYGPPVMPPQPEGIWQVVYSDRKWETPEGEDRYRRAVYTYWKRTSPYPSFVTFDAPSREFCSLDRVATNTPLQALVTLNDPVYFEASQALARRMASAESPAARVALGFRSIAGVEATEQETATLLSLYTYLLAAYESGEEDPTSLAKTPEEAAMIVVASTILNLDKVLTK